MHNNMADEMYHPGANWSAKDGKRNVVIIDCVKGSRGLEFTIRNLHTARESRIEWAGLVKKFRYMGFDPAFEDSEDEDSEVSHG